ncbi:S1C family serine protease [Isobaculum melis]
MAGLTGGLVGAVVTASLITFVPPFNDLRGNPGNNGETTLKNPTQKSEISADVTTDTTTAVAKVQDAVVSIKNLQAQSNNLNFYGSRETTKSSEDDLETVGEGSGVIYKKDGDKAYIVTNNHVIDGSDAIEVTLRDGTKLEATLVGTDQWTDLAVLSVSAKEIETVAEFGDSDSIKQGEPAIAIGSPLGSNFAGSVTQGIISAKDRLVDMDINGDGVADWDMNAIQTDAAINPGNSGGALINISGQVIGINSMKISDNLVEGMGFAIPSNDVVNIINQLEANGKITRPVLGIELRDVASVSGIQQKSILNLPEDITDGVVVTRVLKDTSANKAGLEKYDTIVEINGEATPDSMTLRKVLYKAGVGKKVEIKYYRDGKLETTKVTLEAAQEDL